MNLRYLTFLFKPPSEARGFVLNLTGDLTYTFGCWMIENDQKRSFGDHEIKRLSGGLRKKFGGAKRPARTAREDGCDGKKRFTIFAPRFGPYLRHTFGFFQKKWKQTILFRDFLREKCVDWKNGVYHDEQRGKTKKIAISDFLFSKLCHRDFCKTFS